MRRLVLILSLLLVFTGCFSHHHHGGGPVPIDNPAKDHYKATVVATHQPGFFSCLNQLGHILLGTYMDYRHKPMQAQICELVNNKIIVRHVVKGAESIFNLRPLDQHSVFAAGEQAGLYGFDFVTGKFWLIHPKHLGMGHYQGEWGLNGKWITTEKDSITKHNKSQLWIENKKLVETTTYTWKEFVLKGQFAYMASYFIHKRTEGGLVRINLLTGEMRLIYSQVGTSCYCVGKDSLGRIVYALQHGNSSTLRDLKGPFQEVPDIAWRIRKFGNVTFLLAAEHGWRKGGPSYVYVLDLQTGLFVKVLTLQDCCEPWDICRGPKPNQYYLVSRCEKGNIGRIYLIERTPK